MDSGFFCAVSLTFNLFSCFSMAAFIFQNIMNATREHISVHHTLSVSTRRVVTCVAVRPVTVGMDTNVHVSNAAWRYTQFIIWFKQYLLVKPITCTIQHNSLFIHKDSRS